MTDSRMRFTVGERVRVRLGDDFGPGFYYCTGDEGVVEDGTENGTGLIEDEDPEFVLVRFEHTQAEQARNGDQQYIPYDRLELI